MEKKVFGLGTTHIPNSLDQSERKKLASLVTKLLIKWNLDTSTSLVLLGLNSSSQALLRTYQAGEKALPASADVLERADYLLAIHKALRLLYPEDEEVRFGWVRMPNRVLNDRTPLSLMQENMDGLARVARLLNFERNC